MGDRRFDKTALLGVTQRRPVVGDCQPDLHALDAMPRTADEVVPVFCTGCGTTSSVNAEGAKALSELAGGVWQQYLDKYYEVSHCLACSDGFEDPKLKALP